MGEAEDQTHAAIMLGARHVHEPCRGLAEESAHNLEVLVTGFVAENDRASGEHPHIGAEEGMKRDQAQAVLAQLFDEGQKVAFETAHLGDNTLHPELCQIFEDLRADAHGHRDDDQIGLGCGG